MGTLNLSGLPVGAMLFLDSGPLIYFVEDRPPFADRFEPVFRAEQAGEIQLAVSAITVAEVMVGPLKAKNRELERRYRALLRSWRIVSLDADLAERAALIRASFGLRLPDAVQVASALAINAEALVTHDRDFSKVASLRVIS